MSSNSETSYGSRIGNAEKLVAALQNFNNYQPVKPEYAISEYATFINNIKRQNNEVAIKKQNYSLAVNNRQQVYENGDNSIKRLLSPINGAVKAFYGKTAKESTEVATIIAKIRGANARNGKPTNPNEEFVSQSYQSYNSKAQYFADLIANLTNFGSNYVPANTSVTIANLNITYNTAIEANNQVMESFTQFSQNNKTRIDGYSTLSKSAQAIKNSVKSQYGYNSTEYKLIKGLKI